LADHIRVFLSSCHIAVSNEIRKESCDQNNSEGSQHIYVLESDKNGEVSPVSNFCK